MAISQYGPVGLRYPDGTIVPETPVGVRRRSTGQMAQLYTSIRGTQTLPNPVYTDVLGNLSFCAETGSYDLLINEAEIRVEVLGGSGSGAGLDIKNFIQPVAQTTWLLNHELDHDPIAWQAWDSDGRLIEGYDVLFTIPSEQIRISFDEPVAGLFRAA